MKCFCFDLWQHECWASIILLYGTKVHFHFVHLLLNWIGSQESNSCRRCRRYLNQPLKTQRQQPCCCLCENDNYKGLHKNCWHILEFIHLKTIRRSATTVPYIDEKYSVSKKTTSKHTLISLSPLLLLERKKTNPTGACVRKNIYPMILNTKSSVCYGIYILGRRSRGEGEIFSPCANYWWKTMAFCQ